VSCNENALSIGRSQGFSHLSPVLWEWGIAIDLKGYSIDKHRIDWSNSVSINGQDIMKMLNERGDFFIFCRSCTDITGKPTECGAFVHKNKAYESIPEKMLDEAILRKAGVPA
jgi:hypothetical protein